MTDELLTTEDIAAMYRVSYRTARDIVTKRIGFPPPIPGSTRKKPLWIRSQVRAYIMGKQSRAMAEHA